MPYSIQSKIYSILANSIFAILIFCSLMMFHFLILTSFTICTCHNIHILTVEHLDTAVFMGEQNLLYEYKSFNFSYTNCHASIHNHDYTYLGQTNAKNSSYSAHFAFHNKDAIIFFFTFCINFIVVLFFILNNTISIKTVSFI